MRTINKGKRKIIAFVLIILCIFDFIGYFFCFTTKDEFFGLNGLKNREENSIDVICLGSSEMFTDFSPNLAWHLGGFTSYDYGTNSEPICLMKYMIEEIEKTQSPQLYVIEIYGATYDEEQQLDETALRRYIDNIPLSRNKIDMIRNLQGENMEDYFFHSLAKYHSQWNDPFSALYYFKKKMRKQGTGFNKLNGSIMYSNDQTVEIESISTEGDGSSIDLSAVSQQYLVDLLEYIQEKELNVLFVFNPHLFGSDNYHVYQRANRAGDIIKEYDFDYINFSKHVEDLGFVKRDFYDQYHMNIYGQEKFTKILTDEILQRIEVEPENANKSLWDEYYSFYEQKANEAKKNCKERKTLQINGYDE